MSNISGMDEGAVPPSFDSWRRARMRRERRMDILRWSMSAAVVLGMGGSVLGWVMRQPAPASLPIEQAPAAIAIDMAPEPVSIPTPPTDVPVGPQQTLSIPDPAPVPPPQVTAPPSPAPDPPVPVPDVEKRIVEKKKTKPVVRQHKPVPDRTPADATTAPPTSDAPPAQAQAAPATASSHSAHESASWQGALLARLEKFKRYPAEAQAGRQEGTAYLYFAMDRQGHVLSARIRTGSGHALLDQETLMLIHRAEPLPIPPDSVPGNPIALTVPIEFHLER